LLAGKEEYGTPVVRTHQCYGDGSAFSLRTPQLRKWASALQDHSREVTGLAKQCGNRALEASGGAKVLRSIPSKTAILAIEGEAGPYTEIDGKERRQGARPSEEDVRPRCTVYTA
jgi:hypothetical protein